MKKDYMYVQKVLSNIMRGRGGVRRTRVPRRVQRTPQPPSRIPLVLSFLVSLLIVATAWLRTPAYPGNADLWRTQSIYQIMTDRFAVGGGHTKPCNVTAVKYCGGNWLGIIEKLDYIQNLGFTAIWISPIVKNIPPEVSIGHGEAYHGYWAQDIYSVNPHFGTHNDLLALSSALHARDMLLMVDVAPNHMGSGPSLTIKYEDFMPWNESRYFHPPRFGITYEPPNQTEIEQFWIGTENGISLADVNTELPEVYNTLYSWIRQLVEKYGIDGLRLDTVKHIRKSFWPKFCKAAGVFSMGEVLHGGWEYSASPLSWLMNSYVGPYQNFVPGLLDYVTYYPTLRALTLPGRMWELYDTLIQLPGKFVDVTLLGRFIENHDQPRFGGLCNDTGLRQSALVFNLLSDAIPIVYYGQEMWLSGGRDPNNREALWDHGYNGNNLIKRLNTLRQVAISQDPKFISTHSSYIYHDDYQLFYQKRKLLVGLNGQGKDRNIAPYDLTVYGTPYTMGQTLIDVVSCQDVIAGNGQVVVKMKDGAPVVLYPKILLAGSGICQL